MSGAPTSTPGISALAAANYESLQSLPKSSLWTQLVERLPEMRNAAQYYAYDISKLSKKVVNASGGGSGAGAGGSVSGSSSGAEGDGRSAAAGNSDRTPSPAPDEGEVHYQPCPSVQVAINVKSARLTTVTTGERLLVMCIDNGFAVFEVLDHGVYEICVDLCVTNGPVVAVRAISRTQMVVLTSDTITLFDVSRRQYGVVVKLSTGSASGLELMRHHAIVTTSEFSQILVLSLPELREKQVICADGTAIATSCRWLALCGSNDEVPTTLRNRVNESTVESVAKQFSSGLAAVRAGLWGKSPALQPAQVPLGSVLIHDVESSCDIASFMAHSHAIQCMRFDGSGTLLATASTAGTTVNVFQVMLSPSATAATTMVSAGDNIHGVDESSRSRKKHATVTLLYRLCRGMTSGVVVDVAFGPLTTWIAFSTAVGTCHFYDLPQESRELGGSTVDGHAAPQLMAACRARSAPSTSPVNPILTFLPSIRRGADYVSVEAVIASASGMVSLVRCTSGSGATLVYTKYLDAFNAPLPAAAAAEEEEDDDREEKGDVGNSTEAAAPHHRGKRDDMDDLWRANVELVSHPLLPPLRNFTIPGMPKESSHHIAIAHIERDDRAGQSREGEGDGEFEVVRQTDEWDLADDARERSSSAVE